MSKVLNNVNPPKFSKDQMCFKTSPELYEVFWDTSSHKIQLHYTFPLQVDRQKVSHLISQSFLFNLSGVSSLPDVL